MAIQLSLHPVLLRSARSHAGHLTSTARALAPDHLRPGIKSTVTEENPGRIRITITAKGADARAQEYGSGLHAQKGIKAKYPILPKTKKYLAFQWEIATANPDKFSFLPDGRVLLNRVMHPGIKAVNGGKGYVRPALAEFRKKLRANGEINKAIKNAIVSDIRRAFSSGAK